MLKKRSWATCASDLRPEFTPRCARQGKRPLWEGARQLNAGHCVHAIAVTQRFPGTASLDGTGLLAVDEREPAGA